MNPPMHALTRRPGPEMATAAELTHMDRQPIAMTRALAQHDAYRAALAGAGLAVIDLPALAGHADAAFVEDVALAFPEMLVLTRPGAASRQGEVAALAPHLPDDRPHAGVTAPATIDGGDVLVIGRDVFVGLSRRTNAAAVEQLTALLAPFGYRVIAVAVPGALHLKTAATALAGDLVLLNPEWIDAVAFGRRWLAVDPAEPFGANTLHAGGRIFHAAASPRTRARIEAEGFAVTPLDISEFAKAEAGLTCLSILVPPAA